MNDVNTFSQTNLKEELKSLSSDKEQPIEILRVVVGSQLHGLANENSDTDYISIVMSPLKDHLSPYVRIKNNMTTSTEKDVTTYELKHFCGLASQCNPTVLEALWSNQIVMENEVGRELRLHRERFLSSTAILEAHRGYARHQRTSFEGGTHDPRREIKFAVAAIRVLTQGIQLLRKQTFDPKVRNAAIGETALQFCVGDYLFDLKKKTELTEGEREYAIVVINLLEAQLCSSYEDRVETLVTDRAWVEDFLVERYAERVEFWWR